jgi:type IV secretory pathway VirJ component
VQKRLGRPRYEPPVLVGHSSGAALVYAVLAQAPPGTFRGAISLGFCPVLAAGRPLCRLAGAVVSRQVGRRAVSELRLAPESSLGAPWVALAGARDAACAPDSTRAFAAAVPRASVVSLPEVGHGFAEPAAWLPAFRDAFARLADSAATVAAGPARAAGGTGAPDVRDLPLVEVRPPADSGAGDTTLAVVLSGDGGWASIDRQIADAFAARGVPTVGLNSLQYFWRGGTPDSSARDLARILRHYLPAWRKQRVLLVGYSRGADVLPFMAARLPADLRARVRLVALLAPSREASFEFHLTDWIGGAAGSASALPTRPEIARLRGTPLLCFYGSGERDSACPGLDPAAATAVRLDGGHHLGGDYEGIAERILAGLR